MVHNLCKPTGLVRIKVMLPLVSSEVILLKLASLDWSVLK